MNESKSTHAQLNTSHALKAQAHYRDLVRAFFKERNVLEVATPYLNPAAQIDTFIEPVKTDLGYLPTSPEHYMKRLIADGAPDIYQICKAFRKGEHGPIHRPEFTLIEWYRLDTQFTPFLDENLALIGLFLRDLPHSHLRYDDAISQYGATPCDDLSWVTHVEPHLGQGELTIITHFPPQMAALARVENGFAMRFEIFYEGIELANGFHELNNSKEQRRRYEEANKKNLPLDEPFIEAVAYLPDTCYGVALGFDRLLMLAMGERELRPTLDYRIAPAHTE
jgi:elongation factor P--(R)-beta-lysine ligase